MALDIVGGRLVRRAKSVDLPNILTIYESARAYMIETGNPTQWAGGYPAKELLEDDIEKEQLYVFEEGGQIHGAFAFIIGDDPTYQVIENGTWLNDDEYGTIHRIASDGKCMGVLETCVNFCAERIDNLRIDTHHDNKVMQEAVKRQGFIECGVIYVEDGSARIAYQRMASDKK
ncbi:MAG: N-acetyltransferase [Eubacterium sp.]|nr:N-acetyltransferase [Candidatus Colimonas fimequi]